MTESRARRAGGMAVMFRRDTWRGPVAVSLLLHGSVLLALTLNLSFCTPELKLPPVPLHVKAVVIDRRQPVPQLAPAPELPPPPEPEPPKPEPKKPDVKKPVPKPPEVRKLEPPKTAPNKPVPKPDPKKPDVKPPEPVKKAPPPPPAPDFEALMDREDRTLADQEASRKAAETRAAAAAAARDAATARVLEEYKGLILNALRQRWSRPPSARNGMSVTLTVNLIPGGEVINLPIIAKSSGDAAFDRSAQNAVMLASPLPVPADPAIFNAHFRKFTFVARPEDLKQ